MKTQEQTAGERIGKAIARDVKSDQLPTEWTGLDAMDADQIPDGCDRDEVERIAEATYRRELAAK